MVTDECSENPPELGLSCHLSDRGDIHCLRAVISIEHTREMGTMFTQRREILIL